MHDILFHLRVRVSFLFFFFLEYPRSVYLLKQKWEKFENCGTITLYLELHVSFIGGIFVLITTIVSKYYTLFIDFFNFQSHVV